MAFRFKLETADGAPAEPRTLTTASRTGDRATRFRLLPSKERGRLPCVAALPTFVDRLLMRAPEALSSPRKILMPGG